MPFLEPGDADDLIEFPPPFAPEVFTDAREAVARIRAIYDRNTTFLSDKLANFSEREGERRRVRATYPLIAFDMNSHAKVTPVKAFGYVTWPGRYETTITRPDLYEKYLIRQLEALLETYHPLKLIIGESDLPIPIHFASQQGIAAQVESLTRQSVPLLDIFDAPDLSLTNDNIVDGDFEPNHECPMPMALFSATRTDYSLQRLQHYSGTQPDSFQNFILFTNYQFYIDAFADYARQELLSAESGYDGFISPGEVSLRPGSDGKLTSEGKAPDRVPQMPAYHLTRPDRNGVTLVNIGVGPSNAKTITDHIATLRPHAWLMIGHCAGLRSSQKLGDYVLAHAYVRDDHVLDHCLPPWVPVPALAEIQIALEQSVSEVTGKEGLELKRIMRTGTVVTTDDRNWELMNFHRLSQRLSLSRAIALDMESATVAANGFRLRVPYGTLLCVSDKPLHGEIKLPKMADQFYRDQVDNHLRIAMTAVRKLRSFPENRLHSRKLRSFSEPPFL